MLSFCAWFDNPLILSQFDCILHQEGFRPLFKAAYENIGNLLDGGCTVLPQREERR